MAFPMAKPPRFDPIHSAVGFPFPLLVRFECANLVKYESELNACSQVRSASTCVRFFKPLESWTCSMASRAIGRFQEARHQSRALRLSGSNADASNRLSV